MSRLVWMLAGLLGGLVLARNAAPMSAPAVGAVVLALVAGCGLCWWAAYRGKAQAVAAAVAQATAVSLAQAESRAQAIAQAAVHLHLSGAGQTAPAARSEALPAGEAKPPAGALASGAPAVPVGLLLPTPSELAALGLAGR